MSNLGTFYGIGVGPGDPELMTYKAVRVIHEADVIFAAAHLRTNTSLSLDIAKPHMDKDKEVVPLHFPHTFSSVDGNEPHREAAVKILEVLRSGKSAAFITLGDPMTFSTFTYVLTQLKELEPAVPVAVVPGITSFATAAAAAVVPLAEGEESLMILGAARDTTALEAALGTSDNLVVMKPYRNTEKVCDLLEEAGLSDSTWVCTEVSRPTERVIAGLAKAREAAAKYMSLFLVRGNRKGGPGGEG